MEELSSRFISGFRLVAAIALLLLFRVQAFGETILVGLEKLGKPSTTTFRVSSGSYRLLVDEREILSSDQTHLLEFQSDERGLRVISGGKSYGPFSHFKLRIDEWDSEFRIKAVVPKGKEHVFQDNLIVKHKGNGMVFINEVNLEKYVAGVVESEGGKGHHPEYYKVQSIISRTYMLSNKRRHLVEGYHVCDKVHCQVYHGKSRFEPEIPKAAWATKGMVLVDSDIRLITAAFHSNCGGNTISSGEVWSKPLHYLQSKRDTFCLTQPHSHWEKGISRSDWLNYLSRKHDVGMDDSLHYTSALSYFPSEKTTHFGEGKLKIPLKDIRHDWNLRSAYFSIYEDADSVRFTGKGFGHGVGLCQEGAMRMALLGYGYNEILHFYYTDVHLIQLGVIEFFRDEDDVFNPR